MWYIPRLRASCCQRLLPARVTGHAAADDPRALSREAGGEHKRNAAGLLVRRVPRERVPTFDTRVSAQLPRSSCGSEPEPAPAASRRRGSAESAGHGGRRPVTGDHRRVWSPPPTGDENRLPAGRAAQAYGVRGTVGGRVRRTAPTGERLVWEYGHRARFVERAFLAAYFQQGPSTRPTPASRTEG